MILVDRDALITTFLIEGEDLKNYIIREDKEMEGQEVRIGDLRDYNNGDIVSSVRGTFEKIDSIIERPASRGGGTFPTQGFKLVSGQAWTFGSFSGCNDMSHWLGKEVVLSANGNEGLKIWVNQKQYRNLQVNSQATLTLASEVQDSQTSPSQGGQNSPVSADVGDPPNAHTAPRGSQAGSGHPQTSQTSNRADPDPQTSCCDEVSATFNHAVLIDTCFNAINTGLSQMKMYDVEGLEVATKMAFILGRRNVKATTQEIDAFKRKYGLDAGSPPPTQVQEPVREMATAGDVPDDGDVPF